MQQDDDVEIILGWAGTKSLLAALEPYVEEAAQEILFGSAPSLSKRTKRIRIVRCAYTLFDADEKQKLSECGAAQYEILRDAAYNMQIAEEQGCEREYYEALEKLRTAGWEVQTACLTPMAGRTPIANASGIAIAAKDRLVSWVSNVKGKEILGSLTPGAAALAHMMGGEMELIKIVEMSSHRATVLQDAKAYFIACEYESLLECGILQRRSQMIFTEKPGVDDDEKSPDIAFIQDSFEDQCEAMDAMISAEARHTAVFGQCLKRKVAYLVHDEAFIRADKAEEYADAFDRWLADVAAEVTDLEKMGKTVLWPNPTMSPYRLPVAAVVTDPGPGCVHGSHNTEVTNPFSAQDCDDLIALRLLPLPNAGRNRSVHPDTCSRCCSVHTM